MRPNEEQETEAAAKARRKREARIKALARQAGEPWERITSAGWRVPNLWELVAGWKKLPLRPCSPCFAIEGPNEARWRNSETDMLRCSGCLEYALEHFGTTAKELPAMDTYNRTMNFYHLACWPPRLQESGRQVLETAMARALEDTAAELAELRRRSALPASDGETPS